MRPRLTVCKFEAEFDPPTNFYMVSGVLVSKKVLL